MKPDSPNPAAFAALVSLVLADMVDADDAYEQALLDEFVDTVWPCARAMRQ